MTTTRCYQRTCVLAAALLLPLTARAAADEPARLDRWRLLEYRAADGAVQPATTPAEWAHRRDEIVAGLVAIVGPAPAERDREPPTFEVLAEVDAGSYVRRLIAYAADRGTPTPAYLCLPKATLAGAAAPAILCLHPTDNTVGHQVVVGLGGRAGRHYAAELAERGYVTLAPAYPLLANYQPDLARQGYVSGVRKAVEDNRRGLDLLASLPQVDAARGFGAIGHSLGGHNAIFTAVLEPRITVVASSCGFDSFLDYYDGDENNWRPERGWTQTRYMPRLADYRGRLAAIPCDFPELLGALAPRAVYVYAPQGDGNFRWQSVARCVDAARPVYELLGAGERLVAVHPEGGHDFPAEPREAAYRMMDLVLRPK